MKKIIILIISLAILTGCNNKNSITINGNINSAQNEFIKIHRIDVNKSELIDSIKVGRNGSFRIKVKASEPDFYQVGLSETNFVTLLAEPGEKISLTFDDKNLFNNYTVGGSEGSGLVQILDSRLLETKRQLDSLSAEYDKTSSEQGYEALKSEMEQQMIDLVKAQRKFNIEFVINHINSLATIKALYQKLNDQTYVLYETRDLQYLKIVSDSLKAHYPDSRHTAALISTFEDGMREFNTKKLRMMVDTLPEVKLDAVLKDINGRTIALSSLKGKYVLLTFWTSTSKECITENLQFKEFYRMYNKRGFEIYQISLDIDESAWKSAVRFDELPWISTREENPQSQKSAQIFNIRKVPANFLFNPQGEIIGADLHGKALQLKLTQLFTN